MSKGNDNTGLTAAKINKKDEFYTRIEDIQREVSDYKKHFKNKVVYCNCDDPSASDFFQYFSLNFEALELKKLISSCYRNQEWNLFSDNRSEKAVYLVYEGDKNNNRIPDPEEIGIKEFEGDGDFRSEESIELLKQADIVVTNPPFSLIREYIAQLIEYKKKFIIIAKLTVVKDKHIFPLLYENKMWLGNGFQGDAGHFKNSTYENYTASGEKIEGTIRVPGVIWLTNLKNSRMEKELPLFKKYNKKEFPKYDNYDAIEVTSRNNIPEDYKGVMGVPITFIQKHNPKQFELIGVTNGRDEFGAKPTKKYINPKQHKDGVISNGSKINTNAALLHKDKPKGIYYTADNADGYLESIYTRFLIKNKML